MSAHGSGARKSTAKAVVFALLRFSGVAFVTRHTAQERQVSVLAYHDPDPDDFERHLAVLTSLYSVITLDGFLAARRDGLPKRPLLITLDDGWVGNLRLLPALERHGVRPTVFVSTSVVGTRKHYWWTHVPDPAEQERLKLQGEEERLRELASAGFTPDTEYPDRQALSLADMEEMAKAVDFQAHTRSHLLLPQCTDERAMSEIAGSAEDLERLTGSRPTAIAYPNGDYSDRDLELVREAGYECAFTMDPGYNGPGQDPYRLKRLHIEDSAGTTELIACASGVYGRAMRSLRGLLGQRSSA